MPRLKTEQSKEIFGWQNIELITDRPFKIWIEEFKKSRTNIPTES